MTLASFNRVRFLGLSLGMRFTWILWMTVLIRSRSNEKIKFIDKLKKPAHRKQYNLFLIEGLREIIRAQAGGSVRELVFCPE
ncbi:MAG: hypothetical protein K2L24_01175, partial [Opitutales bacterium]|nr:hypothetical protein [Opitutales bacterium]